MRRPSPSVHPFPCGAHPVKMSCCSSVVGTFIVEDTQGEGAHVEIALHLLLAAGRHVGSGQRDSLIAAGARIIGFA